MKHFWAFDLTSDHLDQGASWTSLEHGGQWKMSHYYAERFFAPTLISPIINKENLEVWAVCDSPTGSLSLHMSALHWTSFATTNSSETSVQGCPSAGAHIQVFLSLLRVLASEENRIINWVICFSLQCQWNPFYLGESATLDLTTSNAFPTASSPSSSWETKESCSPKTFFFLLQMG